MKKLTILLLIGICLLTACSYDSEKAIKNKEMSSICMDLFSTLTDLTGS